MSQVTPTYTEDQLQQLAAQFAAYAKMAATADARNELNRLARGFSQKLAEQEGRNNA